MHPVGPQNPKVYWVRRLLLLGALISTLVLIYSLLTSPEEKQLSSSTPLAAPSQSTLPSETLPAITSTPSTSETPTPTQSPTPTEVAICSDDQISVVVAIDPQAPKVNQSLKLTMSLTNTSTVTCQRDVGSGANEITVISGPALLWSTDHCNPSTDSDLRTFTPGQKMSVTATWSGMQTSKGCIEHNQATAGTYWAHARNASKNSDGVRFVISD